MSGRKSVVSFHILQKHWTHAAWTNVTCAAFLGSTNWSIIRNPRSRGEEHVQCFDTIVANEYVERGLFCLHHSDLEETEQKLRTQITIKPPSCHKQPNMAVSWGSSVWSFSLGIAVWVISCYPTDWSCKGHSRQVWKNQVECRQSQRSIRQQPSAEIVYEERSGTVNTALHHCHSVPALAYIDYLAN